MSAATLGESVEAAGGAAAAGESVEAVAEGDSVEVAADAAAARVVETDPELVETPAWYAQRKHLWVLTYSGKPVYSWHGDESLLSSFMGMLSGMIMLVLDTEDSLQFFSAGDHQFVFLVRGPIYLVMGSRTREPVWLQRAQLNYVYAHLMFSATSRIVDILNKRANADIRDFLEGHEPVLERLMLSLDSQLTYMLQSYLCLPLPSKTREQVTRAVQRARPDNTLYAVMFSENHVVTYLEKKNVPLNVDDLLLLVNWANAQLAQSTASEDGVLADLCLPNLDTRGNIHAYTGQLIPRLAVIFISTAKDFGHVVQRRRELVTVLREEGLLEQLERAVSLNPVLWRGSRASAADAAGSDGETARPPTTAPLTGLEGADNKGVWMEPASSLFSPRAAFDFAPELWHCVFKSAAMQQMIAPGYERFATRADQRAVFRWYQQLYSQLLELRSSEGDSGAALGAGLGRARRTAGMLEYFTVNAKVALLGWSTKNFELVSLHFACFAPFEPVSNCVPCWQYVMCNPLVTYERAVEIAQHIVSQWLPREKEGLFLLCENGW